MVMENQNPQPPTEQPQPIAFQPQSSSPSKTFLALIVIILFVAVGAGAYFLKQNNNFQLQSITSQTPIITPKAELTYSPVPTKTNIIQGTIAWNPNVEQITPTAPLNLLSSIKFIDTYTLKPIIRNPLSINYYNIGRWTNGPYQGSDLFDIVFTYLKTQGINGVVGTQSAVLRASEFNGKIVYFPNSSSQEFPFIGKNHNIPSGLVILPSTPLLVREEKQIPDLLSFQSSTDDIDTPITISYRNTKKIFTYVSYQALINNNLDLSNYQLLTTFSKGQKLYALKQNNTNLQIGNLLTKNLYYIEDLDHSILWLKSVYSSSGTWTATTLPPQITWNKNPLLLTSITNKNAVNSIVLLPLGCITQSIPKNIYANQISQNNLQLVATYTNDPNDSFYYSPDLAGVYHSMYSYLNNNTITFDQFSQSYPILIHKDAFGKYQFMARSYGLPPIENRCLVN